MQAMTLDNLDQDITRLSTDLSLEYTCQGSATCLEQQTTQNCWTACLSARQLVLDPDSMVMVQIEDSQAKYWTMCLELRQWILSMFYDVEVHLELLTKQSFILVCLLPVKHQLCGVTYENNIVSPLCCCYSKTLHFVS